MEEERSIFFSFKLVSFFFFSFFLSFFRESKIRDAEFIGNSRRWNMQNNKRIFWRFFFREKFHVDRVSRYITIKMVSRWINGRSKRTKDILSW